ncbi:hypothetical protein COLO4_22473 [Corchorus olitorius]|uniref:Uncharacterized protein n=1 Tax=Corchorus olitorius TaxID=93759 RepID=A0A1R3ILQ8_9ROSI|nr:hypothetical protein COLO4_22473 [Corchorus olitorius]
MDAVHAPPAAAPPAPADPAAAEARLPPPLDFLFWSGALRASFVFFVVELLVYLFLDSFMRILFTLLISVVYGVVCYVCWGVRGGFDWTQVEIREFLLREWYMGYGMISRLDTFTDTRSPS